MEKDQNKRRHVRLYRCLQAVAGGMLKRIYQFTAETVHVGETPFLVVANHNTDLDPALIALSFPEHMYFVASEHVFRKGWISRLLVWVFAPISRLKGSTDAAAALDIIRKIRAGNNVCLFAEGDRSFSGVTGPIQPATGKLARASGAALVTYRFEGGYLTSPRWSTHRRKGRMLGYCVNVYPPEKLKAMKPEEINAHIQEDLFEDAFLRQAEEPQTFTGKRLAERLEYALYLCPKCGRIGTLHSDDDRFFCDCGLSLRYTETGAFAGEDVPFANVRDWDAWQTAELSRLATEGSVALSDGGQRLIRIGEGHRSEQVAEGTLQMTLEALSVGKVAFPLDAISKMAMVGATGLLFSAQDAHYEIRSEPAVCRRKYLTLYQIIKQ